MDRLTYIDWPMWKSEAITFLLYEPKTLLGLASIAVCGMWDLVAAGSPRFSQMPNTAGW